MTLAGVPDLRYPDWFCQQIDVASGQALLRPMNAASYRQSLFLDERMHAAGEQQRIVPLEALSHALGHAPGQALEQEPAPARFVFHVGHCGSTLLTRLLEAAMPTVLALREPVPLRALAAFSRDLDHPLGLVDPAHYPRLLADQIKLVCRRWPDAPPTLIKPTSDCAPLAGAALASHEDHRALLVVLGLQRYLETMLRSDLRRRELHHFAQSRLADLHAAGVGHDVRLYRLGSGELAAMCWLSVVCTLGALPGERVFWLDFDSFLEAPVQTLAAAGQALGYPVDEDAARMAVSGPVMGGYSKDPAMAYSASARNQELAASARANRSEIESGLRWVRDQARAHQLAPAVTDLIGR